MTGQLQKKQRVEQTVKKKEPVADAIQKKQEELMQPESTALNGWQILLQLVQRQEADIRSVVCAVQKEQQRRFQPLNTALATGKLQKKRPVQRKENRSVPVQEKAVKLKKKTQLQNLPTLMHG